MKRSREVAIIVNALVDNQLITESQTDRARYVIKEAIKDIRRERYERRDNCRWMKKKWKKS